MVTGAVAAVVYGEPRLTHDIDLVIELKLNDIRKISEQFPPEEFYRPPAENILIETQRSSRGHFNIIHLETGFKADCYLMGEDELHHWGMANRKEFTLDGETVWVAPPEYVILRKLEYYREGRSEKHLTDIVGILKVFSDRLDFDQLQEKLDRLGLEEEWFKAKKLAEE